MTWKETVTMILRKMNWLSEKQHQNSYDKAEYAALAMVLPLAERKLEEAIKACEVRKGRAKP